ncbi:hypothetical protein CDD82_4974 [Ophiocordyceps australis]|uniref:Non-structural maintenance of chromosomes element 4 n=1 Tax=Ophiocordyceps australis TaxID=1399860 RepID=A0A2C5YXP2_9HYPO|nr:hypothetical protein CDD82_4974 [Ophiocordyceps australis]
MPRRASKYGSGSDEDASRIGSASQSLSPERASSTTRVVSGSKRKRPSTTDDGWRRRQRTRDGDQDDQDQDQDDQDQDMSEDEDIYDPDQPLEERRTVQKGYRDLLRDLTENGDEYLNKDSQGLRETILKADVLSKKLRQTAEATIDSRLLVSTSDLSYRKALRLTRGSLSQGIDVDEFVSKCITYMRVGGGLSDDNALELELSSTQRQRRRAVCRGRSGGGDDDDAGDDGDMMNWPHLGRFACMPHIRRPALEEFLLGPLSVEKKPRKITKRSAPFRPDSLRETRPQELDVRELATKENDLTSICSKVMLRLSEVQQKAQETVADLIEDDMDDEEKIDIMHRHGLRSTGGIDLMRFVVNPKSFAQTVENMFYVSFLIRDARVEIEFDDLELPALAPVDPEADNERHARHGAAKHQAVLSIDMKTWRDITATLGLTEPMIEHRKDVSNAGPGTRGWYS